MWEGGRSDHLVHAAGLRGCRSSVTMRRASGSQPTLARCSRRRSVDRPRLPAAAARITSMWWRSQFICRPLIGFEGASVNAPRSATASSKAGSAQLPAGAPLPRQTCRWPAALGDRSRRPGCWQSPPYRGPRRLDRERATGHGGRLTVLDLEAWLPCSAYGLRSP